MKAKVKDIVIRALKTFLQAFLGALSVDVMIANPDRNFLKSVLISAVAAGISAVMNTIISALKEDYY